ncbi:dethiobiotin synthase [Persephonella sp.]|uniref:dethiobiotin synthase n=1 Tax=Persephonella sp. TaxID=2060922 RepID=UPI002625D61E|nr:dethiobiotin synthase [Persephonella sp.]
MGKSIFITATDTGVGKTTVSAALAYLLKEKGHKVGYFKPVETGCSPDCLDASTLAQITGQPVDEIVLYKFKTPVAPLVAEEIEGVQINLENIFSHLDKLISKYDYLIVEGAGGIKVPITRRDEEIFTYLDFVYETKMPVLVVSRASLGTINHTTLTIDVLNSINADIIGIVMNGFSEDKNELYNSYIIEEMTGIPVIAKCKNSNNPVAECIKNIPTNLFL